MCACNCWIHQKCYCISSIEQKFDSEKRGLSGAMQLNESYQIWFPALIKDDNG